MPLRFEIATEILEIDEGNPQPIDILKVFNDTELQWTETIDKDVLLTLTGAATECLAAVVKQQTLEARMVT